MKKNYCVWQGWEGTRAWGHISKWAVTDWEILALVMFSMEGSWYTLFQAFPNEVSFSPGELPIMLAMTEWKM